MQSAIQNDRCMILKARNFWIKKATFLVFFSQKKVSFWCFFCWDVFFWKKLKDVFFSCCTHWAFENFMTWHPRISREIQLKISKIQNLWQTSLNAKCIRVRTGLLFFLVNRWWGAPGKCPTSAFRRNIARLSSGLSDLERLSQNSLPRSGFCLSFCCKCWGDYVYYIYIYIYFVHIYVYYIYTYTYIYVQLYAYDFYIIYIYKHGPQKTKGGGYKKSLGGTFRILEFFRRFRQPGLTNSMVRTCTDLGWIVIEIRRMNGSKLSPRLLGRAFFYHLLMGLFQKKSPDNEDWNLTLWRTNVRQWIVFCMNVDSWISNWKVRLVGVSSLTC